MRGVVDPRKIPPRITLLNVDILHLRGTHRGEPLKMGSSEALLKADCWKRASG